MATPRPSPGTGGGRSGPENGETIFPQSRGKHPQELGIVGANDPNVGANKSVVAALAFDPTCDILWNVLIMIYYYGVKVIILLDIFTPRLFPHL